MAILGTYVVELRVPCLQVGYGNGRFVVLAWIHLRMRFSDAETNEVALRSSL